MSPDDVVVLEYPEPALILIAIRHNYSGNYVPYEDMVISAKEYGVRVVGLWKGAQEIKDLKDFMTKLKEEKGIEGDSEDLIWLSILTE